MLATLIIGGIASALIVFGPPIGRVIEGRVGLTDGLHHRLDRRVLGDGDRADHPAVLGLLLLRAEPETPRWQWVSPGGLLGTVIFLLASLGFRFYVGEFGSYGKTYGAFAGVMILIFWLYLAGIAILLGTELNAESERQAAALAGHRAAQASASELQGEQSPRR